jgi:hypothetical protein
VSKKKFTDGLESLFGSSVSVHEEQGFLGRRKDKPVRKRSKLSVSKPKKERPSSGKSFTSDLDSLFEQVLNETIEEKVQIAKKKSVVSSKDVKETKKKYRKPMSGLDALIRQTVETSLMEVQQAPLPTKKRVTFVFDKQKLARLKRIAKIEKAYLKDIIGDLVSEFIDSYGTEPKTINPGQ